MNVEINGWLNASRDKGNPNVDGTDVNIVCSANTGNARSDYFEIMASVLENGEIVDELRETVDVSLSAGQQDSIFQFLIVVRNENNVNIPFIENLGNITEFKVYTSDTQTLGVSPTKSSFGINQVWTYDLTNIINNLPDNLSTLKISFTISLIGSTLKLNGYSQATGHLTGSIVTSTGASQSAENFVILTQTNANSQVLCEHELPWNSSSRSVNANLVYDITVY